jgi:hypothetical protein
LERVQHFFDKVGDEVTRLISNQRLLTSSPTIKLSLFDHLNPSKSVKNLHFTRTDRKMAAQIDFCPHGRKAGAHETAN